MKLHGQIVVAMSNSESISQPHRKEGICGGTSLLALALSTPAWRSDQGLHPQAPHMPCILPGHLPPCQGSPGLAHKTQLSSQGVKAE